MSVVVVWLFWCVVGKVLMSFLWWCFVWRIICVWVFLGIEFKWWIISVWLYVFFEGRYICFWVCVVRNIWGKVWRWVMGRFYGYGWVYNVKEKYIYYKWVINF